jgi:hypothetical protein
MLETEGAEAPKTVRRQLAFEELVPGIEQVMGVKAVFSRLTSRVMCFGGRRSPDQPGRYY